MNRDEHETAERFFTVHKAIDVDTLSQLVDVVRRTMPGYEVWVQGDIDTDTAGTTMLVWGKPAKAKGDLYERRRAAAAESMGATWVS